MKTLSSFILMVMVVAASYAQSKTVYVCMGPNSKSYHATSECRGLKRCSTDIKSVSLETAQKMQRRACRLCYR